MNFGNVVLKKTVTVEKKLETKVTNVLFVTNNWTVCSWLDPEIKKVLLISKESEEDRQKYAPSHVLNGYAHVEVIQNREDYERGGIVELIAYRLHQKYRFTHVIVLNEGDIIRGARLRTLFGLKNGQTTANALRYRDKVVMKEVVQASSGGRLRVPLFSPVESVSDVISFVRQHGYPAVIKPRLGYSSINTTVLRSESDLEKFALTLKGQGIDPIFGLEIEKFVNGPMYHIDGLVLDGKLVFSWPSKYIGTVLQFTENQYIAGYGLPVTDPLVPRLNAFVSEVINCLGSDPYPNPQHFPFHAEAWHTPEDELVLCEIASRGGGGNIKKQIKELFSVNMDEIWTLAQCGDEFPRSFREDLKCHPTYHTFTPKPPYLVGWSYIYPKCGNVVSFPEKTDSTTGGGVVPGLPEYCIHWQTFLHKGQRFEGPKDCADTVVACLVKGKDEEEVVSNIQNISDWFFQNSVWEQ